MKKYDSYKDSGIEWIGDIPEHWNVKRLKNIGSLYSGLSGKSGSDFEKVPTENLKPFINFTNIANNKYIVGDNFGFVKIEENENQNQVKKNDLFFLMSSENQEDVGKSALLLNDYDELYLNSFCKGFRLTINSDARFVNYLLTSSALSQLISLEGRGFTRINLRMEGVENLPIILPQSIEEQTTIANYLDHKTSQIDHLIAKKEQFIQLLEEERVAVINQAVTKGLDLSVPMKDSGIEWLGQIPKHWEVKKLKYLVDCNRNTLSENSEPTQIINYIEIGDVNFEKGITGYTEYSFEKSPSRARRIVHSEDVIVSTVRTYLKAIATIKEEYDGFIASTGFAVLTPKEIYFKFLSYLVLTNGFIDSVISLSKGVSYPSITSQDLLNISICLPNNIEEQHAISCHLDTKISEIDKIIAKTRQEIELLKEYKTALISEVVTGKVDVRDKNYSYEYNSSN